MQAYTSPEAAVLTRIFTMLLEDYLNETAYDAKMACLSFSVHATTTGFLVSFYGCALSSPRLQLAAAHKCRCSDH